MPISLLTTGNPINGTAEDDFIFGSAFISGAANTMNGNGGDDLIVGDLSNWWNVFAGTTNSTIATAIDIDNVAVWFTEENALIGNATTVPHTTVLAEATAGQVEVYRFTAGAGAVATVDIDFGRGDIGVSVDLIVEILDAGGTVIFSNDDSAITNGGLGSTDGFDSYLTATLVAGGTYYVRVRPFSTVNFDGGETWILNLSVTGHAASAGATQGDDIIAGGAGRDTLIGNGGNDDISGGDDNDIIDAGTGTNTVHGDGGADTIYVNSAGSYFGDAGNDLFFTVAPTADALYDGGAGADFLDLSTLVATSVVFDMETGDALIAGALNRTFLNFESVTTSNQVDEVYGTSTDDIIRAGLGNDTVDGRAGNDVIEGGAGGDILIGGAGSDTLDYFASNAAVVVALSLDYAVGGHAEGDTISGFENVIGSNAADVLIGTGGANNIIGNNGNDRIDGAAGNDVLNGGGGFDRMIGGLGSDIFFVTLNDTIEELAGEGDEVAYVSGNYTLNDGAEVEALIALSFAATVTGNEFGQSIYGNIGPDQLNGGGGNDNLVAGSGNDLLDGGSGADVMRGEGGNDTYRVDSLGDQIFETSGDDTVQTSIDFTLAGGLSIETIGTVAASATTSQNLTGNDFGQSIFGNAGANGLHGDGGNDSLNGLEGNDFLIGGGGNDVLNGGADRDEYRFNTNLANAGIDVIVGFATFTDGIALDDAVFTALAPGALPAGAFRAGAGASAQDADDRIIYDTASGALFYDADGVGGVAQIQFATLQGAPILAASDFGVI